MAMTQLSKEKGDKIGNKKGEDTGEKKWEAKKKIKGGG